WRWRSSAACRPGHDCLSAGARTDRTAHPLRFCTPDRTLLLVARDQRRRLGGDMRQDTERRILDALRAYVHDVIVDALSDFTPARARKAPAPQPTSTTLHLSPQQARIVAAVR